MNRTYKVAKSLTRGVVVTSEKASSYQGKAVKTVIAAAVAALVAGTAIAATDAEGVLKVQENKTLSEGASYSQISINDAKENTKVSGTTLTLTKQGTAVDSQPDSALFSNVKGGTFEFDSVSVKGAYAHGLYVNTTAGGTNVAPTLNADIKSYDFQSDWKNTTNGETSSAIHTQGGDIEATFDSLTGTAGHLVSAENQYPETADGSTFKMAATVTVNKTLNFNATDSAVLATVRNTNQAAKVTVDAENVDVVLNSSGDVLSSVIGSKDGASYSGTAEVTVKAKSAVLTGKRSAIEALGSTTKDSAKVTLTTTGAAVLKATDGSTILQSGASNVALSAKTLTINEAGTASKAISLKDTSQLSITATDDATIYGAVVGTAGTAISANTKTLTLDDASGFLGTFNQTAGTTSITGAKYFGGKVNVQGGSIETDDVVLTDTTTIGQSDAQSGNASFKAKSVTLGKATTDDAQAKDGTFKTEQNGVATIDTLTFATKDSSLNNAGTLVVNTVDSGDLKTVSVSNTGTIETSIANLIKSSTDEEGDVTYTATAFGSAASTGGVLIDTNTTDTYSLDAYKDISSKLGNKFNFTNANIVSVDAEGKQSKLNLEEIGSSTATGPTNFGRSDVIASYNSGNPDFNGNQFLARPLTIGSLEVAKTATNENELKSLTIGNASANPLTLRGNAKGEVIIGAKEGDKLVDVTFHRVDLGAEDTDFGTIDNAVTFAAQSTITGAFTFTNEAGTTVATNGGNLTVNGTMTTNGLTNNGQISVNGDLDTAWYEQGDSATAVVITDGTFAILGNKPAATTTQAEGDEEAPKAFENAVKVQTVSFGTTAGETNLGVLSVGASTAAANAAAADAYGEIDANKSVIYIAKQAVFGDGTEALPVGGDQQATDLLVDIQGVAGTAGYAAKDGVLQNTISSTGTNGAKVTLVGVQNAPAAAFEGENGAKTLKLAASATGTLTVDYGTMFYGTSTDHTSQGTVAADGTISFARNKAYDNLLDDTYQGGNAKADLDAVSFGHNQLSDAVVWGLTDYIADVKASDGYIAAGQNQSHQYLVNKISDYLDSVNTASVMALAGGAFNTALDVNDQVTAALERRTSLASLNAPRTTGVTPWVDVFGTTNEGKRLYGEGYGYEADIYGAVLGLDYTASCGATIGLAFNVGQADSNSVGDGIKVDNDSDFYGVSLYAAQQLGDFNLRADVGYTKLKNDLSTNTVFGQVKESEDADVFTFGVGTEYLAKFGALNIVPHAGIRLTRIDMDDSKFGADYDTMTVYQMPLGVAFSGTFDTNGWKVAPMVDLSVVPTFGDKDVKYTFVGASDSNRVFDSNPIRATIGVEAQKDAWTFGLNYGLTAGSNDRLNNAFNANLRYSF